MRNLWILIKMQLKEQLNFKRRELKNVKAFDVVVSTLAAVLKFALVVALCAAFLIVAKWLGLFSISKVVPTSVISLVFSVMLVMSTVACTIGITKAMYFSRDNSILLTLPCKPFQVYMSKLAVFFVFELKRNLSFIIPLFVAYFITHGYPITSYLWLAVCMIFISLLTVAIGSLLSLPAMLIAVLFRRLKALQAASAVLLVAGATAALFFAISLIPENIDLLAEWNTNFWKIQAFLTSYTETLPTLHGITLMMTGITVNLKPVFQAGPTALRFFVILAVTALCLLASFFIVRPLFYKMASKPFEYAKRKVKTKKNRVLPRAISALWTEWLVVVKGSNRLFSNIGILISMPMLIFLLNKIFLAMNTRQQGDYMIVAINVLIILLIALNANFYASSIYSRDGRSSYLIKTQPARYWPLLIAKLVPNTVFMLLAMIATFVILLLTTSIGAGTVVMLMVSILAIYLTHLLYCAELDLMNPQIELYATVGGSENNPNENRATLTAFIAAFGIAAVLLLLLLEPTGFNPYIKLLVGALLALAYRLHIFFAKIRLYYKEK